MNHKEFRFPSTKLFKYWGNRWWSRNVSLSSGELV